MHWNERALYSQLLSLRLLMNHIEATIRHYNCIILQLFSSIDLFANQTYLQFSF